MSFNNEIPCHFFFLPLPCKYNQNDKCTKHNENFSVCTTLWKFIAFIKFNIMSCFMVLHGFFLCFVCRFLASIAVFILSLFLKMTKNVGFVFRSNLINPLNDLSNFYYCLQVWNVLRRDCFTRWSHLTHSVTHSWNRNTFKNPIGSSDCCADAHPRQYQWSERVRSAGVAWMWMVCLFSGCFCVFMGL